MLQKSKNDHVEEMTPSHAACNISEAKKEKNESSSANATTTSTNNGTTNVVVSGNGSSQNSADQQQSSSEQQKPNRPNTLDTARLAGRRVRGAFVKPSPPAYVGVVEEPLAG